MILMLGVAGSGKSTQSQLLADTGKYRCVSIGEVLRRSVSQEQEENMQEGKLLDDDVVIGYFEKEVERLGLEPEIIIDGFPRSVYQADWLVGKHASSMYSITAVIHIEVAKSVVLDRLAARGRSDDTEEAINARFAEYDKAILPVMHEFEKHAVPIISVDGAQDPAQVHIAIEKALTEL